MTSEYKDLKVEILPTAERSSFTAGLMQLAVKLAVHKDTDNKANKTSEEQWYLASEKLRMSLYHLPLYLVELINILIKARHEQTHVRRL